MKIEEMYKQVLEKGDFWKKGLGKPIRTTPQSERKSAKIGGPILLPISNRSTPPAINFFYTKETFDGLVPRENAVAFLEDAASGYLRGVAGVSVAYIGGHLFGASSRAQLLFDKAKNVFPDAEIKVYSASVEYMPKK